MRKNSAQIDHAIFEPRHAIVPHGEVQYFAVQHAVHRAVQRDVLVTFRLIDVLLPGTIRTRHPFLDRADRGALRQGFNVCLTFAVRIRPEVLNVRNDGLCSLSEKRYQLLEAF